MVKLSRFEVKLSKKNFLKKNFKKNFFQPGKKTFFFEKKMHKKLHTLMVGGTFV